MRTGQTACCPTLNRFNRAGENSKTGLRTSIGGNGAVVSPGTQPGDVFVAGDRERLRAAELNQHNLGGELLLLGKRRIESGDDGLLDFCAGETFAGRGERSEIKLRRVAPAALQMDAEEFRARLRVRQIHEEDLVEAAFAQQLRRQSGEVVGRGDNEDAALAVLQPGQESRQDT